MKKPITVNQSFCDVCGKEASGYQSCNVCGKEFCYDCVKTDAVDYPHGVYCSGSGDGLYCRDCDLKMLETGDKLHAAFRRIKSLRNEAQGFYKDFEKRSNEAEKAIKVLQGR